MTEFFVNGPGLKQGQLHSHQSSSVSALALLANKEFD